MRRVLKLAALVLLWPTQAPAQLVYFGNLHSHTAYSDGSGTPQDAYSMARAAGLDFFAITEHNHPAADGKGERRDGLLIATRPSLYAGTPTSLVETANRLNDPGKFVTIYGQEVSTFSSGNHINVFDVASVVDVASVPNGALPAFLSWTRTHLDGAGLVPLLQFNHPRDPKQNGKDYGRDDFTPQSEWVRALDPFVELIEVLNAPALKKGEGFRTDSKEGYYLEYLNLGFHAGPSVGQDNHWRNWGKSTDARIGVVAASLTRPAILKALRARHTFASEDRNLKVIFRSGTALGGDIITAPAVGSTLPLTVEIKDPDEPAARYRVDVLSDVPGGDRARRPVDTFFIEGNTLAPRTLDGITLQASGQFILLKVTQQSTENGEDGDSEHEELEDRLWTAPIWFESIAPIPAMISPIRITSLLPNPAGDDAQNEVVTLTNAGAAAASLTGWQLRDASDNSWSLAGTIAAGQSLSLRRSRQPMSLNNDGDAIDLVNPTGTVIDTVTYGTTSEGLVVVPSRP